MAAAGRDVHAGLLDLPPSACHAKQGAAHAATLAPHLHAGCLAAINEYGDVVTFLNVGRTCRTLAQRGRSLPGVLFWSTVWSALEQDLPTLQRLGREYARQRHRLRLPLRDGRGLAGAGDAAVPFRLAYANLLAPRCHLSSTAAALLATRSGRAYPEVMRLVKGAGRRMPPSAPAPASTPSASPTPPAILGAAAPGAAAPYAPLPSGSAEDASGPQLGGAGVELGIDEELLTLPHITWPWGRMREGDPDIGGWRLGVAVPMRQLLPARGMRELPGDAALPGGGVRVAAAAPDEVAGDPVPPPNGAASASGGSLGAALLAAPTPPPTPTATPLAWQGSAVLQAAAATARDHQQWLRNRLAFVVEADEYTDTLQTALQAYYTDPQRCTTLKAAGEALQAAAAVALPVALALSLLALAAYLGGDTAAAGLPRAAALALVFVPLITAGALVAAATCQSLLLRCLDSTDGIHVREWQPGKAAPGTAWGHACRGQEPRLFRQVGCRVDFLTAMMTPETGHAFWRQFTHANMRRNPRIGTPPGTCAMRPQYGVCYAVLLLGAWAVPVGLGATLAWLAGAGGSGSTQALLDAEPWVRRMAGTATLSAFAVGFGPALGLVIGICNGGPFPNRCQWFACRPRGRRCADCACNCCCPPRGRFAWRPAGRAWLSWVLQRYGVAVFATIAVTMVPGLFIGRVESALLWAGIAFLTQGIFAYFTAATGRFWLGERPGACVALMKLSAAYLCSPCVTVRGDPAAFTTDSELWVRWTWPCAPYPIFRFLAQAAGVVALMSTFVSGWLLVAVTANWPSALGGVAGPGWDTTAVNWYGVFAGYMLACILLVVQIVTAIETRSGFCCCCCRQRLGALWGVPPGGNWALANRRCGIRFARFQCSPAVRAAATQTCCMTTRCCRVRDPMDEPPPPPLPLVPQPQPELVAVPPVVPAAGGGVGAAAVAPQAPPAAPARAPDALPIIPLV